MPLHDWNWVGILNDLEFVFENFEQDEVQPRVYTNGEIILEDGIVI